MNLNFGVGIFKVGWCILFLVGKLYTLVGFLLTLGFPVMRKWVPWYFWWCFQYTQYPLDYYWVMLSSLVISRDFQLQCPPAIFVLPSHQFFCSTHPEHCIHQWETALACLLIDLTRLYYYFHVYRDSTPPCAPIVKSSWISGSWSPVHDQSFFCPLSGVFQESSYFSVYVIMHLLQGTGL